MTQAELVAFYRNIVLHTSHQDFRFQITTGHWNILHVEIERTLNGKRERCFLTTTPKEDYAMFHQRFWDAVLSPYDSEYRREPSHD